MQPTLEASVPMGCPGARQVWQAAHSLSISNTVFGILPQDSDGLYVWS